MKPLRANVTHRRRARYTLRQPLLPEIVARLTGGYSDVGAILQRNRKHLQAANDVFPPAVVLPLTT